jgi:hypothetical protein
MNDIEPVAAHERRAFSTPPAPLYTLRSLFAGLMLAVVAAGGVAAPLVHEAAHATEREAIRSLHAADGHHTSHGDGGEHISDACPNGTIPLDLACTLCHGLTAALVVETASVPGFGATSEPWSARPPPSATGHRSTPTGRGPPVA